MNAKLHLMAVVADGIFFIYHGERNEVLLGEGLLKFLFFDWLYSRFEVAKSSFMDLTEVEGRKGRRETE